jgi:hypothetical protein
VECELVCQIGQLRAGIELEVMVVDDGEADVSVVGGATKSRLFNLLAETFIYQIRLGCEQFLNFFKFFLTTVQCVTAHPSLDEFHSYQEFFLDL